MGLPVVGDEGGFCQFGLYYAVSVFFIPFSKVVFFRARFGGWGAASVGTLRAPLGLFADPYHLFLLQ